MNAKKKPKLDYNPFYAAESTLVNPQATVHKTSVQCKFESTSIYQLDS